jgi:hypothetical protein
MNVLLGISCPFVPAPGRVDNRRDGALRILLKRPCDSANKHRRKHFSSSGGWMDYQHEEVLVTLEAFFLGHISRHQQVFEHLIRLC